MCINLCVGTCICEYFCTFRYGARVFVFFRHETFFDASVWVYVCMCVCACEHGRGAACVLTRGCIINRDALLMKTYGVSIWESPFSLSRSQCRDVATTTRRSPLGAMTRPPRAVVLRSARLPLVNSWFVLLTVQRGAATRTLHKND